MTSDYLEENSSSNSNSNSSSNIGAGSIAFETGETNKVMSNKSIFYKGNDDDKPKRKGDKATTFFAIAVTSAAIILTLKLVFLYSWP